MLSNSAYWLHRYKEKLGAKSSQFAINILKSENTSSAKTCSEYLEYLKNLQDFEVMTRVKKGLLGRLENIYLWEKSPVKVKMFSAKSISKRLRQKVWVPATNYG